MNVDRRHFLASIGVGSVAGLKALSPEDKADALEHYLDSSEQLETRLWLSVDEKRAGGLLIQKLPHEGAEKDEDAWS